MTAAVDDRRPGLDPRRLASLLRAAVERVDLELHGRVVVTEAATGAYAVTPVLAALAGADEVQAVAAGSRYGTVSDIAAALYALAREAGVETRIELVTGKHAARLGDADIVTNSGHLRPLDAPTIARMKPGAAIPLMYEAWELRPGEVDLAACRRRAIRVGGTNECHPAVDVFSYLAPMAIRLLGDAGVSVHGSRLVLLCDNPFAPYIERGLTDAGALVTTARGYEESRPPPHCDAILVAMRPGPRPVLSSAQARVIARWAPGAVVVQFWGDLDRAALAAADVPVWPAAAPPPGHMGILPAAIGPEPVVRLQAGGLKVGEVLVCGRRARACDLDFVQLV